MDVYEVEKGFVDVGAEFCGKVRGRRGKPGGRGDASVDYGG